MSRNALIKVKPFKPHIVVYDPATKNACWYFQQVSKHDHFQQCSAELLTYALDKHSLKQTGWQSNSRLAKPDWITEENQHQIELFWLMKSGMPLAKIKQIPDE